MRKIKEKVGVLNKLKRELRQAHKLNRTESGFPGIHWWHLKYWDKDLGLKVKKEEPSTPTLVNIKVKSPPTLNLQYPSQSPMTPSSHYHSLDPNNYENWGLSYRLKINSHYFVFSTTWASGIFTSVAPSCNKPTEINFTFGHLVFLLV